MSVQSPCKTSEVSKPVLVRSVMVAACAQVEASASAMQVLTSARHTASRWLGIADALMVFGCLPPTHASQFFYHEATDICIKPYNTSYHSVRVGSNYPALLAFADEDGRIDEKAEPDGQVMQAFAHLAAEERDLVRHNILHLAKRITAKGLSSSRPSLHHGFPHRSGAVKTSTGTTARERGTGRISEALM